MLVSQYVTAERVVTKSYKGDTREASIKIWDDLEEVLIPTSKSLSYLLTRTLPEVDGKPLPLNIKIAANPGEPLQIVFSCLFEADVCEPFFSACASLGEECTGVGLTRATLMIDFETVLGSCAITLQIVPQPPFSCF